MWPEVPQANYFNFKLHLSDGVIQFSHFQNAEIGSKTFYSALCIVCVCGRSVKLSNRYIGIEKR